ncbi:MAG: DNA mismatch repair protein MutS [Cytophagales bacterium]|nr:DNA mismatch repair protein MutS [Cytophagales bacterium]
MFKKRLKQRQAILERQQNIKDEDFDFESISLFFSHEDHQDAHQIIDERTLHDLDFEELFISLDRTTSCIGQQYLYAKLRVLPRDHSNSQIVEQHIEFLNDHPEEWKEAIIDLNALNDRGAYFIQRLFFGDQLPKPKWFWLIPTMSVAVVIALLVSIFYSQAIIFALLLISINTIIHLWNKNNIMGYSNTIPQLLQLHKVAATLNEKGLFFGSKEKVGSAIRALNKIWRASIFFKWESKALGEIAQTLEYVLDLVKGALLIEPLVLFRLLRQIESNKSDIKVLYEAIGQLDMAISVSSWRESLPYYCIPEFSNSPTKTWDSEKLYHPLIHQAVDNDLKLSDQKSILLTGSNMSGKSTFIRTIGINALLAQTLNTACASTLYLSPFKIYSAIRISDDLFEHTSYYYQEVKTIKKFADESQLEQHNLFLLDEIFKGTNTVERIASGKAVLTYLDDAINLVFCSTHDLELIDYLQENYAFYHFEEKIVNDQLTFDYLLKKGSLNHTNAIRILEINDFPNQITEEAKGLADELLTMKRRKA